MPAHTKANTLALCEYLVLTVNDWVDDDETALRAFAEDRCHYMICGKEVGHLTNKKHLQCYFELKSRTRFGTVLNLVKKMFSNDRGTLAVRAERATAQDNVLYCSKGPVITSEEWLESKDSHANFGLEADFWEHGGARPKKGARTDLKDVREIALEGGMAEVVKTFNSQAIKVAYEYTKYHGQKRNWEPELIWIHGPAGTCKSKYAKHLADQEPSAFYVSCPTTKGAKLWFDGYSGESCIVLDDFRPISMLMAAFLQMVNPLPHMLEIKGGFVNNIAHKWIVTTTKAPEMFYQGANPGEPHECVDQLMRRINEIITMIRTTDCPLRTSKRSTVGYIISPEGTDTYTKMEEAPLREMESSYATVSRIGCHGKSPADLAALCFEDQPAIMTSKKEDNVAEPVTDISALDELLEGFEM